MKDLTGDLLAALMAAPPARKQRALEFLKSDGAPERPAAHVTGPLLMGMSAAARFLGVSRATLWRMIQAGRLQKIEILPGSHRLRRADLEELAQSNKTTPDHGGL